jgi:excisionase family DNA binding protein
MQTKHAAFYADHLPISAAAALIGVSTDTLRRWEKAGRITSVRTPTNHRRFLRADIEALLTIKDAS